MSLSQMIAQTLLEFRADTSQARQEIKKLAGEERKAAEESLAANEKRNSAFEKVAGGITKVNAAMGIATEAIKFAADAWKTYDEMQDLAGASSLYNIDKLRKATRGLVTDMDLMRLGAASQATTFKLTQEQLEMAAKAMRAFEQAGFDGVKVQEKVRQAILKGSIEPLKELGVNLEIAKTSTDRYNQLLGVLAGKSIEAGEAELDRGDKMKQAIVEYENSMTQLKASLGELVVAFQPVLAAMADLIALTAKVAAGIASAVDKLPGGGGGLLEMIPVVGGFFSSKRQAKDIEKAYAKISPERLRELGMSGLAEAKEREQAEAAQRAEQERATQTAAQLAEWTRQLENANKVALQALDAAAKEGAKRKAGSRGPAVLEPLRIEREIRDQEIIFEDQEYRGEAFAYEGPAIPQAPAGKSMFEYEASSTRQRMEADLAAISEQARLAQADLIAAATGMEKAWLESTFGPLEDFDAYGRAFQGLSSIITDTFSQWTQGADITAASLKKMTGALLGSLATEMMAKSIQHAAYAVGSLFLPGQQAAAAGHAAAAAKFAAGAVVIGGLARSMSGYSTTAGAGAGSTAGGYGSGGAASVGGGTERDMGRITNLYVGDVFSDDNPRTQRQKFARIQRAARRELDTAGGVEFR